MTELDRIREQQRECQSLRLADSFPDGYMRAGQPLSDSDREGATRGMLDWVGEEIEAMLPKPYYEEPGITVYCADCRDILPLLPKVDLVLTDPPYNAGFQYGAKVNDQMSWPAYCGWLSPIISQLEDISAGPVFTFLSVNALLYMASEKRPRHVCVWDKPISFSPRLGGSPFLPHWEACAIYGKVWGDGGRVPNYRISDVWHANPSERNGHPCPKPVGLFLRILRDIPGDLILDPFLGSGTTLVAAKQLGRRAIGIEIEEKYCAIAVDRLRQAVLPLAQPAPPEQQHL